jgi:hypothetical protein
MRGDIIFQVFGTHTGRQKDTYFGAFRTREAAQARISKLQLKTVDGANWAERYHDRGFVIREKLVDSDFEIPTLPAPRLKYVATAEPVKNRPGAWDSTLVSVYERGQSPVEKQLICTYTRNYAMLQTFEPFRQGNREFALISHDYTKTAVLDLHSGKVIAEESDHQSSGLGFCPAGFFVPDWWDVHDGCDLPGSDSWSSEDEWPVGNFGFVWGCRWGDDSSWKVQYLDLTRVGEGILARDNRFGYVELATAGYVNPCLVGDLEAARKIARPSFIRFSRHGGTTRVTFAVEMPFDLDSGKVQDWQRLRIGNLE